MFGSGRKDTRAPKTAAQRPQETVTQAGREKLLTALLLDAVHHRMGKGQATTLRDLHTLLDVPQPVALRLARKLELDGLAVIEPNLSDAFAAEIRITPAMVTSMNKSRNPWSAKDD